MNFVEAVKLVKKESRPFFKIGNTTYFLVTVGHGEFKSRRLKLEEEPKIPYSSDTYSELRVEDVIREDWQV